jgi:hypothetical protein
VKYIRQSTSLTALGNLIFDHLYANIAIIHTIFRRAIGERLLEGAIPSTYSKHQVIDVANHYFTPTAIALPEDIRPLTAEVDPFGSLAKAAGTALAYVHTEENKVYYFEKTWGSNGETM